MITSSQDVESIYELSPLQAGMLVECLAAPDEGRYVEQVIVRLGGSVDVSSVTRCWQLLVDRYPALRTTLHWRDLERPLQAVHRRATVGVRASDLARLDDRARDQALRRFLVDDRAKGFELSRAPLVRVTVLRTAAVEHYVVVTLHHIVLDGWSLSIVMGEFSRLYAAGGRIAGAELGPVPPFSSFIAWLREASEERSAEYWRSELAGYRGAPTLADWSTPGRPGEIRRAVPPDVVRRLRAVARHARTTLNTVVLGAWGLAVGTTLGVDDVVVATVVSGRNAPIDGIEQMVGLLINTVPSRVIIDRGATVAEWMAGLHRRASRGHEHQHCALTEVHGWSDVPRGTPMFESILVFENHVAPAGARPGTSARALERTGAPLTVIVHLDDGLGLTVLYDGRTVGRQRATEIVDRYLRILGELTGGSERTVDEVAAPSAAERAALAELEWGVRVGVPGWSVGELFGRVVGGGGDGVAVVVGGRVVSFGELDRCVGLVGERLVAAGVRAGVPVGVVGGVGLEQIVGGLAVLGLGAVWVPVDPELPVGRAVEMVADAAVAVAVVAASVAGWWSRVDPAGAVTAVVVDGAGAVVEVTGAGTPGVLADDAAWVLFTSGTSGRPKGVIGSTAGLVNRLWWWWRTIPYQPGDRAVVKTRPGFVDAIGEVLVPLLAGVPVVVADSADPGRLAELVAAERVTHLLAVPSLLAVLYDTHGDVVARAPLRVITSSGEPLTATLAATIRATNGDATIVNLYGSTETSGDATAAIIGPTDPTSHVTIGRPIDNVTARILDHHGQLLPPGATGHLHIGGAALTHGYLPTVAADDHARYWHDTTQRWYATGDLARWRPDGTLEHLGRHDRQTKIRGVRVEPAGIEHTLITIDHITDAAVTTRHHPTRGTELTAYLVLDDPHHPLDHIRQQLRATLPTHHLPTHLIPTTHIPRTATGKIDHHALTTTTVNREPPVEPRNATEQMVAEVFAEVLDVDHVGAFDDFFGLGGHSLLATRTISRLSAAFGVEVSIADLFTNPVVTDLASEMQTRVVRDSAGDDRG